MSFVVLVRIGPSDGKDGLRCSYDDPANHCNELPCQKCGAGHVDMDSILYLFAIGFVARLGAFLALVFTNRHKQV
eukprot:SAG11_NODE_2047_length_3884_cov_1.573844_8_plen_75_part_00